MIHKKINANDFEGLSVKIEDCGGTKVVRGSGQDVKSSEDWFTGILSEQYDLEYEDSEWLELWFEDNKLHRRNGPAVITTNGSTLWFQEGRRHRGDGPAGIHPDGVMMWALNGIEYPKEEWFKQLSGEQLAIALTNPENF